MSPVNDCILNITKSSIRSKRHHDFEDTISTSVNKRRRHSDAGIGNVYDVNSPMSSIIRAVNRLSTNSDLTADVSRDKALPTIPGKHKDLNAISPNTVSIVTLICVSNCVFIKFNAYVMKTLFYS